MTYKLTPVSRWVKQMLEITSTSTPGDRTIRDINFGTILLPTPPILIQLVASNIANN